MSRTEYLKTLFSELSVNEKISSELLLLKKIILLCHQGELKINDQYPDKQFTFADYLLDDRRVMLDWSRLSESHCYRLKSWLLREHQAVLKSRFWSTYTIDEDRGLPEEKTLSWWQQCLRCGWFDNNNFSCSLERLIEAIHKEPYCLSKIDISFSKNGALIDLVSKSPTFMSKQLLVTKDYLDKGYLQNVKRVLLTDDIVELLLCEDIKTLDLTNSISEPHPHAIEVISPKIREQLIFEHRHNRQYNNNYSFFWRIILLIKAWWLDLISPKTEQPLKHTYNFFCYKDGVEIFHCPNTGKVFVYEKKAEIDSLGLCGGGARIFSYLGVVDVLEEYGIKPKKYSGSSAGAIMASLLFLGYESKELKDKFRWITDNLLLDYSVDFSGLSTTDKIKSALQYFILNRVQNEIKKNTKWFASDEAKAFLLEHVDSGHITFATIKKLKSMCPELSFGDELYITVTNKTLRRTELFSTVTTPEMEIAEAVKISASMPVIYKPTIIGRHSYTDGGVLNNLPLSYFSKHDKSFISHELGGSLSVLALQFSTGVEESAVYSNKPVYREHWLLNFIYSLLIGITDPVSAWVNDRLILRHHGGQAILIDVKNIKATKFDINEDIRDELIASGRTAATEYMAHRYRKEGGEFINDEYLSTTFENLEALLIYCGNNKKWQMLDIVLDEVKRSKDIEQDYRQKLLRVGDALVMIKNQEALNKQPFRSRWRKLLPVLSGLNRMKIGHKQEQKDKSNLYCTLFPVLSQKWLDLLDVEKHPCAYQDLKLLEEHRKKLNIVDQVLVFNSLVDKMETVTNSNHLFYYILKTLLIYGRNEDEFDSIKFDVLKFTRVFSVLKKSHILNVTSLISNWDFNVRQCQNLLNDLQNENFDDFLKGLGLHYKEEFDLRNQIYAASDKHQLSISL